jgi:hypothetical protein
LSAADIEALSAYLRLLAENHIQVIKDTHGRYGGPP